MTRREDDPSAPQPRLEATPPANRAVRVGARRQRAQERAGRSIWLLVLVAVAVAGVLAAAGWWTATRLLPQRPVVAPVGSCVALSGNAASPADCGDTSRMTFLVARTGTGAADCPDTGTQLYVAVERPGGGSQPGYYCLAPNLHVDHCYALDNPPTEQACGQPQARVKVVQRLKGGDATRCGEGAGALPYPELDLTFCVSSKT